MLLLERPAAPSGKYQLCITVSAFDYSYMSTYWDSVGHQGVGVHDGDQLVQQVRLRLKQLWSQFPHHLLQLFCSKTRSSIPGFGLPPYGEKDK